MINWSENWLKKRKLVEKVIVYDNRLVVEFKSGFVVEVKCLCKMFVGKDGMETEEDL